MVAQPCRSCLVFTLVSLTLFLFCAQGGDDKKKKTPAPGVLEDASRSTAAADGKQEEEDDGDNGGDESEYDDDDVVGAASGLRAAGDGKFDFGLVFRMMDRDKDGVVSIRDWGVATGSGPGLGARMTNKQVY
jgi:hypothetical protein